MSFDDLRRIIADTRERADRARMLVKRAERLLDRANRLMVYTAKIGASEPVSSDPDRSRVSEATHPKA